MTSGGGEGQMDDDWDDDMMDYVEQVEFEASQQVNTNKQASSLNTASHTPVINSTHHDASAVKPNFAVPSKKSRFSEAGEIKLLKAQLKQREEEVFSLKQQRQTDIQRGRDEEAGRASALSEEIERVNVNLQFKDRELTEMKDSYKRLDNKFKLTLSKKDKELSELKEDRQKFRASALKEEKQKQKVQLVRDVSSSPKQPVNGVFASPKPVARGVSGSPKRAVGPSWPENISFNDTKNRVSIFVQTDNPTEVNSQTKLNYSLSGINRNTGVTSSDLLRHLVSCKFTNFLQESHPMWSLYLKYKEGSNMAEPAKLIQLGSRAMRHLLSNQLMSSSPAFLMLPLLQAGLHTFISMSAVWECKEDCLSSSHEVPSQKRSSGSFSGPLTKVKSSPMVVPAPCSDRWWPSWDGRPTAVESVTTWQYGWLLQSAAFWMDTLLFIVRWNPRARQCVSGQKVKDFGIDIHDELCLWEAGDQMERESLDCCATNLLTTINSIVSKSWKVDSLAQLTSLGLQVLAHCVVPASDEPIVRETLCNASNAALSSLQCKSPLVVSASLEFLSTVPFSMTDLTHLCQCQASEEPTATDSMKDFRNPSLVDVGFL